MSLEEKYEEELYVALQNVTRIVNPRARERIYREALAGIMRFMQWPVVSLTPIGIQPGVRSCRVCGCTEKNCSQCIERTGGPCHWVDIDLCSACRDNPMAANQSLNQGEKNAQ